jgi:hypothetical protein
MAFQGGARERVQSRCAGFTKCWAVGPEAQKACTFKTCASCEAVFHAATRQRAKLIWLSILQDDNVQKIV